MQTLVDPFEVAPKMPPPMPPGAVVPGDPIAPPAAHDPPAAPAVVTPGASLGLRCWCSED